MPPTFDPYHKWLGIPPAQQPPNCYRLLSLEVMEDDADVISHAADRQMAYLRSLQAGPHAAEAQRLLNEVARARICLLDPTQKEAYDAQLLPATDPSLSPIATKAAPTKTKIPSPPEAKIRLMPPPAAGGGKPQPPKTIGPFAVEAILDESRTGWVLKAVHTPSSTVVALKVFIPQGPHSEELNARFRRKAGILSRLTHPNLITVYESGVVDGHAFLAMEYVEGMNLSQLVKRSGPLPPAHGVNYVMQAAAGLGHAHNCGVFHRNVKPANLLVNTDSGAIKVIGMGLARINLDWAGTSVLQQLTAPGTGMGTFDYTAPEQFSDASEVDHRADIYSLGCTLYVLLTGRVVYGVKGTVKKGMAHRDAPIPPLGQTRDDISPKLEIVYQKMLAKRRKDRYQSMDELIAALNSV